MNCQIVNLLYHMALVAGEPQIAAYIKQAGEAYGCSFGESKVGKPPSLNSDGSDWHGINPPVPNPIEGPWPPPPFGYVGDPNGFYVRDPSHK